MAKWKGKEYHGVLTDGEPISSHVYAQKRNSSVNGGLDKNLERSAKTTFVCPRSTSNLTDGNSPNLTLTGKSRGKRSGRAGTTEKKVKNGSQGEFFLN